ncbi:MAG TPA: restriction endonuclease [Candidatus Angelobacter sp.]|nr:restriction endonuclease [Candidatus Angelobacter sp.]
MNNTDDGIFDDNLGLGDEVQTFSDFIQQPALHAWVAAHVRREFPRLAAGIIVYDPASKQFQGMAMPNSSPTPNEFWEIHHFSLVAAYKRIREEGRRLVGFFSTRYPGKPPTPEQINGTWIDRAYWIVSTNPMGDATDSIAYFHGDSKTYKPLTAKFSVNPNTQIFATTTQVIGSVVQTANGELMRWLQKHPHDLLQVHPGTFEQIIAELFRDQGFDVEVLGSWNQPDGGIDIIAVRKNTLAGTFRVGIQCKRFVKTGVVKADLVWALEGRMDKFRLNKGVLATTAHFEKSVLADLKDHLWRIELRDFEALTQDLQSWGRYEHDSTGLWLPKRP